MKSKQILQQLKPYEQGMQVEEVKKKFGLNKIVKLASNENPFGYSKKVDQYISNNPLDFSIYPDGYAAELRESLSHKLNIDKDELVLSAGLDEMILLISRTYLEPGKNAVMADLTFPQYKHQARIEGASVKEVPLSDQGGHDLESMLQAIDEDTTVVWICSPNNPTGTIVEKEALISFLEKCPSNVLVVLDEAYFEFIDKNKDLNSIGLTKKFGNLLVMRTFSKAYGLAGLRIGYAAGSKAITRNLNVARGPFNTSSLAQKAAKLALEDELFIQEVWQKNQQIRTSFEQFLDELGWQYYPSETNFLFVKTPGDDMDMFEKLLERGFIVRPGAKLGCPNTMRITIGEADDMEELKQAMLQIKQTISRVK